MKNFTLSLFLVSAIIFQSCLQSVKKEMIVTQPINIDTAGSCPHLTTDQEGNIVLSWIKETGPEQLSFCYAISRDKGQSFGKPILIPGSENVHPNGENMPKIIFKPSGEIIAAWPAANPNPKNNYSDIVFYTQSFDAGKTWTERKKLVADTSGFDQRYFDMAILSNGEAAITWLDNRKNTTYDGSGLYFATTIGDDGFQNEHIIGEPACECCRTALLADHHQNIHVVYRAILNDSIRDMVHAVSADYGKTFSEPREISKDNWVINGCPHTGPAITENKQGLHFSWFTGGDQAGVYYCKSDDNGQTFSPRQSVSGSKSRHSQIAAMGEHIVTVWNETFLSGKKLNTRIGIQVANEAGSAEYHSFITPVNIQTTFPVIHTINEQSVLVAYTSSGEGKDYISAAVVEFR